MVISKSSSRSVKTQQPKELIDTVKKEKADIGLAFDGDADRLGVVDAYGRIVWPDRQLILFAKNILKNRPGASIVYDVKCTGVFLRQSGS